MRATGYWCPCGWLGPCPPAASCLARSRAVLQTATNCRCTWQLWEPHGCNRESVVAANVSWMRRSKVVFAGRRFKPGRLWNLILDWWLECLPRSVAKRSHRCRTHREQSHNGLGWLVSQALEGMPGAHETDWSGQTDWSGHLGTQISCTSCSGRPCNICFHAELSGDLAAGVWVLALAGAMFLVCVPWWATEWKGNVLGV